MILRPHRRCLPGHVGDGQVLHRQRDLQRVGRARLGDGIRDQLNRRVTITEDEVEIIFRTERLDQRVEFRVASLGADILVERQHRMHPSVATGPDRCRRARQMRQHGVIFHRQPRIHARLDQQRQVRPPVARQQRIRPG